MEKKLQKYILYITIIDCTRFMERSLSKLANNLSEGIHRIKCKLRHDDKKNMKIAELNVSITMFWNRNVCVET